MVSKKIILLLFISVMSIHGQTNPLIKSLILPGWGESVYGEKVRARIFYSSEAVLWTSAFLSGSLSKYYSSTSKAYAAEYAGIDTHGKEDRYWIDIGNYDTRLLYNAEHLRWRDFDNLYDESSDWEWESTSKRERFDQMRIRSDKWGLAFQFFGAGLVLNRIISVIDIIYLKNHEANSLTVVPTVYKDSFTYNIIYRF